MPVNQREIIEVNFKLPGDTFKPHPVIVLSNNSINEYEEAFVCVMVSGNPTHDDYSFPLENTMLTKVPKKKCQVRCHLISLATDSDITGTKYGEIRTADFKKLLKKIETSVFN